MGYPDYIEAAEKIINEGEYISGISIEEPYKINSISYEKIDSFEEKQAQCFFAGDSRTPFGTTIKDSEENEYDIARDTHAYISYRC